ATHQKQAQHGRAAQHDALHRGPLSAVGILKRRSSNPSTPSAIRASSAAGIAPASTRRLSTDATPRKINSPSPPAPTAAAIVAMPMQVTVAVRSPAKINEAASG